MTSCLPLLELVESLPHASGPRLTEQVLEPAFTAQVPAPTMYVWPDLDVDSEDESQVLLITAPGAMGKSIGARAVASKLNAPVIDLARVPIGSDSLTGLLTRVLGWQQAPEFVMKLQAGESTLVLDSLDEAHLAAGRTHFEAFLQNIVDLLAGGAERGQVLIFGRRDTMDTAALVLAEHGLNPKRVSVAPLGFTQSCELIDGVLDDVIRDERPYTVHRVHAEPFARYREAVLMDMAKAIGCASESPDEAWSEYEEFLGYPPVLMVLARHMEVDNPAAALHDLRATSTSTSRGGLLRQVTEEILDREGGKVQKQMSHALEFDPGDPRTRLLYSRDEQIARVTGYMLRQPLAVRLPGALTADESAIYQEQIEAFVPDHPFLKGRDPANVVFGDYLRAYATLSDSLQVQGLDLSALDARPVGPFFAHFIQAMAPKSEPLRRETGFTFPPAARVPERIVDALIKSFALGSFHNTTFVLSAASVRVSSLLLAETVERGGAGSMLDFKIEDTSGLVELSSPLSRGVCFTDGGVSISTATGEVNLGPDLSIFCGDLILEGQRVTATGTTTALSSPSGGVTIVSRNPPQHAHDLKVSSHPAEALDVYWEDMWHQWQPHKMDVSQFEDDKISDEVRWQVAFGIRRILSVFHASAVDDPTVYYERLENFTIGSNRLFALVLAGLLELEVVSREASVYRVRLNALGTYGINYAMLRSDQFVKHIEPLTIAILKTRAVQDNLHEED